VTLSVDPTVYPDPANWWTPIAESGSALGRLPINFLPVRGTTVALFQAITPGQATVTSTRSICLADSVTCTGTAIMLWRVTVNVI